MVEDDDYTFLVNMIHRLEERIIRLEGIIKGHKRCSAFYDWEESNKFTLDDYTQDDEKEKHEIPPNS